jgi:hypothetical protein
VSERFSEYYFYFEGQFQQPSIKWFTCVLGIGCGLSKGFGKDSSSGEGFGNASWGTGCGCAFLHIEVQYEGMNTRMKNLM